MVGKGKVRITITMEETSKKIIQEVANSVHMTFSEFVEGVSLKFIEEVIENTKKLN